MGKMGLARVHVSGRLFSFGASIGKEVTGRINPTLQVVVLAVVGVASVARADNAWTLTDAHFADQRVHLVSIDDNGIRVDSAPEPDAQSHAMAMQDREYLRNPPPLPEVETNTILWTQVLGLDRLGPVHALFSHTDGILIDALPDEPMVIYLNGGDHLAGTLQGVSDDQVAWHSECEGITLKIPEDRVNAIARKGVVVDSLDQQRDKDTVRLSNGDQVSGIFQGVSGGDVAIQPANADSPMQIPLANVQAVLLADTDPRQLPPHRLFRLTFADGSTFSFDTLHVSDEEDAQAVPSASRESVSFYFGTVKRIEQMGGPVQWLTTLSPQVEYRPFLDESFPPQFEHTVADPATPLSVHYAAFHHGIGVHSYTKLTYAIPPGYTAFRTQYAIDPIPGLESTKADMTLRLLLDGTVKWEQTHVRSGVAGEPAQIDLGNAKSLALEADYGDNVAAQDRLTWLDPAFIRTDAVSPQTQPAPP